MPWRDHVKQLKDGFNSLAKEVQTGINERSGSSQPPQQQYHANHQYPPQPPAPAGASAYWRPRFQQDIPVTVEWDAKLGNGPDGWGNQELQHYTALPENTFHTQNGLLVLRALANSRAPNPEQKYTSARLVSRETLSRDRGALTAVIQSPCARGIWPAFWLLPQEPFSWPTDGEIDIAETWNGDCENHSCLHWGHHHEPQKHRVLGTKIHEMPRRPVRYDLVWDQPGGHPGQGRLIWFIDGRPVMKGHIPGGTRPMRDMTILLNVAMGGNVCQGVTPSDGYYDMVVHSLYASDEPELGGWHGFDHAWGNPGVPEGHGY
ncbi:Glycosyl hydrolases family 16 [Emericellopsis cladophorae]|uniref:Glycosyl hydrolases family 16 n=1 Tax=Emericellopsis cladophorae TaxID=2686198 RepID=A0A9Q0B811_9HYPO|nr:Glycosyl hydrolases family 16 [Emericellopsis cladophorae]KAI6777782.1 Glycosyl hydrolases family 16 [Emericellopsis cladophorae]